MGRITSAPTILVLTLAWSVAQAAHLFHEPSDTKLMAVSSDGSAERMGDTDEDSDWSRGASAWKQVANLHAKENLWGQPNFCDARAVHGSAPLTLLFGLSNFWDVVKKRRNHLGSGDKPLELHILGSSYPFEGRANWSLLARKRPANVPGVRVVLVLGTPWQSDNVPTMTSSSEWSEPAQVSEKGALLQDSQSSRQVRSAKEVDPETGKVSDDGVIRCDRQSNLREDDAKFTKEDLCRDHGNGLEVVCVEKFYQDAVDDLPKPDLVAFFSPGFPQMARATWDPVLRSLLQSNVPIMVSDLYSTNKHFYDGKNKLPAAGSNWELSEKEWEAGMTLMGMNAYEARRIGAKRNPFPIVIPQGGSREVIAKNAALQVFQGRKDGAKPFDVPSAREVEARKALVEDARLEKHMEDPQNAKDIITSMTEPTSAQYFAGMWKMYKGQVKEKFQQLYAGSKFRERLSHKQQRIAEDMGLTDKQDRDTPWTFKEWMFALTELKFGDNVF